MTHKIKPVAFHATCCGDRSSVVPVTCMFFFFFLQKCLSRILVPATCSRRPCSKLSPFVGIKCNDIATIDLLSPAARIRLASRTDSLRKCCAGKQCESGQRQTDSGHDCQGNESLVVSSPVPLQPSSIHLHLQNTNRLKTIKYK